MSPFHDKSRKCPGRTWRRAKALLAEAGLGAGYGFELTVQNQPPDRRLGEVIQGMAKEAGFNMRSGPPSSPRP